MVDWCVNYLAGNTAMATIVADGIGAITTVFAAFLGVIGTLYVQNKYKTLSLQQSLHAKQADMALEMANTIGDFQREFCNLITRAKQGEKSQVLWKECMVLSFHLLYDYMRWSVLMPEELLIHTARKSLGVEALGEETRRTLRIRAG